MIITFIFFLPPSRALWITIRNKNPFKIHETILPNIWFSSLAVWFSYIHTYSPTYNIQVVQWVKREKKNRTQKKEEKSKSQRFFTSDFFSKFIITSVLGQEFEGRKREYEAIKHTATKQTHFEHLTYPKSDFIFPWVFTFFRISLSITLALNDTLDKLVSQNWAEFKLLRFYNFFSIFLLSLYFFFRKNSLFFK